MFKSLLFAACATLAVGAAHAADDDFVKQSIDATRPSQIDLAPDGTAVPSDLTLDTAFGAGGLKAIWPPEGQAGWSLAEDALRVFPWVGQITIPGPPPIVYSGHKGYYLVGKQKNTAGDAWRAWITRVNLAGALDTTFGTDGWIYGNAQDDIVDAAVVGDKLYLLSNIWAGTAAPPVTRVACKNLDTATGSDCFPVLGGVQTWGATAAGPRTAAYGQRLAYDSRYGLFVAARVMNNDRGQELGIARISADDGSLVTAFRDGGYNIGLPAWGEASGHAEISINALAITPTAAPGPIRLYVAGQLKRTDADHDGFIIGMSPVNGTTAAGWSWNDYYYEGDNASSRKDAITAITVLRNGKVAFAGWSESDSPSVRPMMMGRIHNDGGYDAGFCANNPNRGARACLVDPPFSTGAPYFADYEPFSWPVALAERRQNRDLVVAQRFQNSGGTPEEPDDNHVRTLVQQFGANGNRLHAGRTIDIAGGGSTVWSRPFDLWMGGTGLWNGAEGGLGEEVIAIAGTRLWSGNDFDATLTHLRATDSLFADAFGGVYGD